MDDLFLVAFIRFFFIFDCIECLAASIFGYKTEQNRIYFNTLVQGTSFEIQNIHA